MEKANHQTEKNSKRTSTEKMKKKTRGNDKEEIDIGSQDSMVKSQDKVKKGIKGDVNKKQKKILDRSEGLKEKQKKTTIEKNQEEIKDDGKELKSLVEKAKEIRKEIKEYMVNYKPCKSLPKVGDSILEEYVDTTKGISEEDRDDLTAYLCTFEELNFTVLDIPSMVHDTISFIIHHSDRKDINETVMPARKQEKRTIKKKIIYDPDDYQSPKKKTTQSSGGLGAMNMNYQQCSPTKEIKEKDFKLCEYPQNLETGQWVLVRPNKSEDEENIPWVGEVTKVTSTHIYFDWCEGDFGQDWQSGTLIPKSDKTTTDNILASFEWDYVNLKKMPDGLQTQLKLIWDS
ncbi:unnamed protein product [Mytilus edulis]|uniref:Uncharacterized protein n=1 Tax=Mytilus edulis TaxID=6550 RepID=A0A8S3S2Y8_MYTED|nr:unnamed protein product [Mytilus edulis]